MDSGDAIVAGSKECIQQVSSHLKWPYTFLSCEDPKALELLVGSMIQQSCQEGQLLNCLHNFRCTL